MRSAAPLLLLTLAPAQAQADTIGLCGFDRDTLAFAGSPVEQAQCLLQRVERRGALEEQALPETIERLLAHGGEPSSVQRERAIARLPEPYRTYAAQVAAIPASRTRTGLPARYFVIHDTSTPFLGDAPFPADLDSDPGVNSFAPYLDGEPVAHIFLNRAGQIWAGHDFAIGWRATKLESWVVGIDARGRMLHIEVVQPRRFAEGSTSRGDTLGPEPGFTDAQYRMLAALYVYASARSGGWLIPAFHATIDAGIPDAHDDPQDFDLGRFADAVGEIALP